MILVFWMLSFKPTFSLSSLTFNIFSLDFFIRTFNVQQSRLNAEGNGTQLQYSCLENPMDGGGWWAAAYGVTQSHTRLKRLSSSSSSSSHVWMWELDHKESWVQKNWCFWTVLLEKTLENPLYCKEIQSVHPKGNQSWIFIGRTDAEAETPITWPPDAKNLLLGKDPDAGKDWSWGKGTTEDEMVGWHHQWTWVWASSGSWWWTGKPGVQSMALQRVGHQLVWLNWTKCWTL